MPYLLGTQKTQTIKSFRFEKVINDIFEFNKHTEIEHNLNVKLLNYNTEVNINVVVS